MRRWAALQVALVTSQFLLAACATESPEPTLPTLADTAIERECACVERGECAILEIAGGEGETRGFQCRWDDRANGRATCTYESRFKPAEPPSLWSAWSRSTVRLQHLGEQGWCWMDRSSESEFTR